MAPKKRVLRTLHIEKPCEVGGSVISLYELVRGLNREHFESVVLFYGPHPYRERFQKMGVQVIVLNEETPDPFDEATPPRDIAASLSRYISGLAQIYTVLKQIYLLLRQDWPLARRVAQIIDNKQIDLVHQNNSIDFNQATVLAARLAGKPQVCHARSFPKLSFYEKYLARFVSRFIYISKAVEQHYRDQGIADSKGELIYNPIDFGTFMNRKNEGHIRAEFGLSKRDFVISNIARFDWWKGQDYFIRALAEILREYPQGRIKALLVGQADPNFRSRSYYRRVRQLVNELGLSEHVIFTGYQPDVAKIMVESDLILHSATEPEPFGRVIVEAMAVGRPVVATNAGGVPEIIDDQVTGLLVPVKNVPAITKALGSLIENRSKAISLGQRAQQVATTRFSVKQQIVAVEKIFHETLL